MNLTFTYSTVPTVVILGVVLIRIPVKSERKISFDVFSIACQIIVQGKNSQLLVTIQIKFGVLI